MEELEAILETGGAAAVELAASAVTKGCTNCGAPLTGRFCASCGQPLDSHRRSVRHLTSEFVKDIASFDSRILRTVVALMTKPGELAAAFREGRTQRFVPPVRLYLFISLIFFVILSASEIALVQFVVTADPVHVVVENGHAYEVDRDGSKELMPQRFADGKPHYMFNSKMVFFAREGSVHADLTPLQAKMLSDALAGAAQKEKKASGSDKVVHTVDTTMTKLVKDPAALNGALTAWIPRTLFLLLPLFALLVAAFYWRQRKGLFFVDHLVFSLGVHSFAFALLLIAAGVAQVVSGDIALLAAAVVFALYLLLAMKRFYCQNWLWTAAKFTAVSLIYTAICLLPAFAFVIVAAVMWG
jgi:hypothetical protein